MHDELGEIKREKLNVAVELIDDTIQELQELREKFVDKIKESNRIKKLLD